jgi:hypothetical protein
MGCASGAHELRARAAEAERDRTIANDLRLRTADAERDRAVGYELRARAAEAERDRVVTGQHAAALLNAEREKAVAIERESAHAAEGKQRSTWLHMKQAIRIQALVRAAVQRPPVPPTLRYPTVSVQRPPEPRAPASIVEDQLQQMLEQLRPHAESQAPAPLVQRDAPHGAAPTWRTYPKAFQKKKQHGFSSNIAHCHQEKRRLVEQH